MDRLFIFKVIKCFSSAFWDNALEEKEIYKTLECATFFELLQEIKYSGLWDCVLTTENLVDRILEKYPDMHRRYILDLYARKFAIRCNKEYFKVYADELLVVQKELTSIIEELKERYKELGVLNLASPLQVKKYLWSCGIKVPKTDRTTLQKYSYDKRVEDILYFKDTNKYNTSFVSSYLENFPPNDKCIMKIPINLSMTKCITGRAICKNPNLQQIPKVSSFKKALRPSRDGFKFLSIDYSQIELRTFAILTQDKILIQAFKDGKDIHAIIGQTIFSDRDDLTLEVKRSRAKKIVFGILYGMGYLTIAKLLDISSKEARELIEKLLGYYPSIARFTRDLRLEIGRTNRLKVGILRDDYIARITPANKRNAVNYVVQSGANDILKIAIKNIIIDNKYKDIIYYKLQVHDEIVYEVKEDYIEEVTEYLKQMFSKSIYEEETYSILKDMAWNVSVNISDSYHFDK